MKYLNLVDYGVITAYLLILLVIGRYLKKRAYAKPVPAYSVQRTA